MLLGFLALYTLHTNEYSISGKPTRDITWIIGITELAIYLWIRIFAKVGLRTQIAALASIYGLQLGLYLSVRIDGFMGDGRPIWAWRWEQALEDLWQDDQSEIRREIGTTANLQTTTQFDYPGFRGIERNGIVPAIPLSRDWTRPPQELWRHPVGLGWSSFAVVGDYCVTQEQRGAEETVVCYELRTGDEVWIHSNPARFDEVTGGVGPRATPTIHNGRVFALGATGILNCLEGSSGKRLWSTNILTDTAAENALFGMSGSPLIYNDLVIVNPGGKNGSLAAYDQKTGARVWAGGVAEASYSSPQFAAFSKFPQILSFNAEGLFAHDPNSGAVLWNYAWVSNPAERNNVCQPIVLPSRDGVPDQVFIASGYGKGCVLLELSLGREGYVVRERWRNLNLKAKFSSAVLHGKHVYGLDERILVCIDLETGKRRWKRGRYGYGQLALANDLLIVQAESGDIVLLEATPDRHNELGKFAALHDRTWNHPVISRDLLLVRNDREAACFRLPSAASP